MINIFNPPALIASATFVTIMTVGGAIGVDKKNEKKKLNMLYATKLQCVNHCCGSVYVAHAADLAPNTNIPVHRSVFNLTLGGKSNLLVTVKKTESEPVRNEESFDWQN